MSKIVVGLDTDSYGFHWVSNVPLWDGSGDDPEPSLCGAIEHKADLEERRATSYLSAKAFFGGISSGTGQELHVFCEEPLALKNGKTTRVLGLAAGAIWAAFVESGGLRIDRYWYWVDVAHWKKEVVQHGNASKELIRDHVRGNPAWRHHARQRAFEGAPAYGELFELDKNLYDAWCLCVYGVRAIA
jgi:hypothetical protein